MILPLPEIPRKWQQYPMTWCLLGLNVFIFLLLFLPGEMGGGTDFTSTESLKTTGQLYFQYMKAPEGASKISHPAWVQKLVAEDLEQMELLGGYALRDRVFLNQAEKLSFQGDMVRIAHWKKELTRFKKDYFGDIMFVYGLYSYQKPLGWITYQFSHSGWMHLLSNMVFLVVMALAVERIAGSMALLLVYLLGGFAGGLGFLFLSGSGIVPMVGASASVSALLAFYVLAESRKNIRYGFFISPMPEQHGVIYLPTLLIIPLFLIVDFANLISAPEGLGGGVAYSAHIGGTLFGLLAAVLWRYSSFSRALTKS